MLYPPEVTDNFDNGEYLSDEADCAGVNSESIKIVKKPKNGGRRVSSTYFSSDFTFDADASENEMEQRESGEGNAVDQLDGLRRFMKQNGTQTSLEDKIKEERRRICREGTWGKVMIAGRTLIVGGLDSTAGEENEIGLLQEAADTTDRLNVKFNPKKTCKAYAKTEQFFDSHSYEIAASANSTHNQLTFTDLNLSRPLLKSISEAGFQSPTPIQAACIPVALSGRDICASSATGTGKTAAFMLPILERLLFRPSRRCSVTRVLVLVPTRELAIQVFQVSRQLSKYTQVEICLAAGGLDLKAQEAALRLGLDIVIATPGRLIDHLHNSPNFSLANIEVLVLDEADRMLDEQFTEQMKEIIKLCARNRQTMLFSATMTDQVEDLASLSLNKPVKLFINENTETAMNLHQEFIRIRHDRENEREAYAAALITRNFPDRCILFVRTKRDCEKMYVLLGLLGVKAGRLHGGRTQVQRLECLHAFKRQEKVEVLCATDLAARGLDIEGVTTVINMHMPNTVQHYIHRVGRTARAGKAGRSISLVGEQDRKLLKEIVKVNQSSNSLPLMQRKIEPDVVEAYHKRIQEMEQCIIKLLEAEQVEKQLIMAENSIKKAEKGINSMGTTNAHGELNIRKWIGGREQKSGSGKQQKKRLRSKGRRREAKKIQMGTHSAERVTRESAPKQQQKGGGTRKKSAFTAEIANVSRRAVKRVRNGPDDIDFKRAKREKQRNGIIRKANRK